MKNLNIRTLNEYRPTTNPQVYKLIIKNLCEIEVSVNQMSYLKKKIWVGQDNKIVALIGEEIVEIQKFLQGLKGNIALVLPCVEKVEHKALETVTINAKKKVYFDKCLDVHFVYITRDGKKLKKYFSKVKYGSHEKAKEVAQNFIDFKATTK